MPAADTNPLLEAALRYAAAGVEVFPCRANKAPYTENGMKDATRDPAIISEWWRRWPDALVAARIPADRVVLDVDPRHGGDVTWAELQRAYHPIESARRHVSGRGDGGTHHWFKRPAGKLSAKKLHEWAKNNGVGQAVGKRSWTSGIDILHHDHRYSILPPSPHPDTGAPYSWEAQAPADEMPPWLATLITADEPTPAPPRLRSVNDPDSIADWFTTHHTWNEILSPAGWVLVSGDGDGDGSKWRHPNATAESSASVRHGCLFVYSDNTDFSVTEDGDPRGVTRFRAWATLEHHGDLSRAAHAAREARDGPIPAATTIEATRGDTEGRNLPDEFWAARPVLEHIRTAAHSRLVSADAVLLGVLARVVMLAPPNIVLPAIVGSPNSLNLFAAILDPSGGGKSAAVNVARELVQHSRKDIVDPIVPSSGEGLIEAFFENVEEPHPDTGQKRKVKKQTKTAGFAWIDEGQTLLQQADRSGATIMPTIRSAWNGGDLGQHNATEERKRILPAHRYRLPIVIGLQLSYAADLIADAEGGTPQRFTFTLATDPHIDRSCKWPGPLELVPHVGSPLARDIVFDETVAQGIADRRYARSIGALQVDPLDTHQDLRKMKLAAALALLDGSLEVTPEDWHLAEMIDETSCAVRSVALAYSASLRRRAQQAAVAISIEREAAIETAAMTRAINRVSRTVARKVWRDGPLTHRSAWHAVASRDRAKVTKDDVLAAAVDAGWVVWDGDNLARGGVQP